MIYSGMRGGYMPFVEPLSIKEAIDNIDSRRFLLPAIQREFVWSTEQIENLFDSIMKEYPISSFLFWEVDAANIKEYQFYEFILDYHERDNNHNHRADVAGKDSVTAVLDGQQRLTALYIGLKGSYASKVQWKRWSNDQAFPKKKLHLNLLGLNEENGEDYEFRFLSDEERNSSDDSHHWFPVRDILGFHEYADVNNYLLENDLMNNSRYTKEQCRFANKTLFQLYKVIFDAKPIIFFLEKGHSLDKVLNIFIRVNSGGTKLSYSDLLLSIASAQWKTMDAREEIIRFVDEINDIGNGFAIDKDFVLKTCLVLCDFSNIAFKVDNFKHDAMETIEKNWKSIADSIRSAFHLADSFGFDRNTLASNAVMIPVAYYLSRIGNPSNYIASSSYSADRQLIKKYMIISLLKRNFSGQPDNVIRPLREIIRESGGNGFPLQDIILRQKGTNKDFSFDDDEIENLFEYHYGQAYTFAVLAVLYPSLDFRNKFHIDHIFPKSQFSPAKLRKAGIKDDMICFYLDNFNFLANLQLLEGTPNIEKSDKPFDEWLNETYPAGSIERSAYIKANYIPETAGLTLSDFPAFIEERKKLMSAAFKALIS